MNDLFLRFRQSWQEVHTLRSLIIGALFLALTLVLGRLSWYITPAVKVTFTFLSIAAVSMLFGPVMGAVVAGLADILGSWLFPVGPYFFGFTLSGIVGGLIYGLLLYKRPVKFWRALTARLLVILLVNIGLNTLWLSIFTKDAFLALMLPRVLKNLALLPVDVVLLSFVLVLVNRAYQAMGKPH